MSSGTRRFNYTRRFKIKREDVPITLRTDPGGQPATFDAALSLSAYTLPEDARIFLEAYRKTAYQRFAFGTAGAVKAPENRVLTEFGAGEGVHFRVKVVEHIPDAEAAARPARVLAHADKIKPIVAGRRRSLLAVEHMESRDQVWRLEVDADDANTDPILFVSRELCPDRHAVVRSPGFVALALPEILRRVLTTALASDERDPDENKDDWPYRWSRLGCNLLGEAVLRAELDGDNPDDAREKWVEEAVLAFCKEYKVSGRFNDYWGGLTQ